MRENERLTDQVKRQSATIHVQAVAIQALDEQMQALKADAARYTWLKAWNKLDGWSDSQIDRQIAIDKACADAAMKEQS